jgi:hypothetical protein
MCDANDYAIIGIRMLTDYSGWLKDRQQAFWHRCRGTAVLE